MYAIVDIETTGGFANGNGITEIAIILHNGMEVEGKFQTLINPNQRIPHFITVLTGIDNFMVADAPIFEDVAENVFNLLSNRIFVAHNVNFDYSFIKHQLQACGYELNAKKLCTVRMARKVIPGLPSYSLGNLCRSLSITIEGRHRAYGDAAATATLFEKILAADSEGHVAKMLKGKNKEQYLPTHLPAYYIEQLPMMPGVYYFHDSKGKIIYVGKATNLQRRVKSHFSNNDGGKRKQDLLRKVYSITHKECSSELVALILESIEIRKLWPEFNRSQKGFHQSYGLYTYEDRKGYVRFAIEKRKQHLNPLYTFNLLHEGQTLLRKMAGEFEINERLCFGVINDYDDIIEDASLHNEKVLRAITALHEQLPTFAIFDGSYNHSSILLMNKGKFSGIALKGEFGEDITLEQLKERVTPHPDNDYIRGLIYQYAEKYPERKILF
jgi:DNA polymerase-3 subunit epsilon